MLFLAINLRIYYCLPMGLSRECVWKENQTITLHRRRTLEMSTWMEEIISLFGGILISFIHFLCAAVLVILRIIYLWRNSDNWKPFLGSDKRKENKKQIYSILMAFSRLDFVTVSRWITHIAARLVIIFNIFVTVLWSNMCSHRSFCS